MSEPALERPARKPRAAPPAVPPQLPEHRAQVRSNNWTMAILLILVALFLTLGASDKAERTGHSPWSNPFTHEGWKGSWGR